MTKPKTQTDKLADFFLRRPDRPIQRVEVDSAVAGGSYRQEISRLRRLPYAMRIRCVRLPHPRLKRKISFFVYDSPKRRKAA